MAYDKEKDWVREKIRSGSDFPANSSHYQTLKRAAKNQADVAAFMREYDVESRTY